VENRWKYSNLALSLAGYIVEALTKKTYEEYVKENILEPLGMTSSFAESPDPDDPKLATGYSRRLPNGMRGKSPFTDTKGIAPAANMATTVEDLARFAMLQFRNGPRRGSQILRGSTLREMHRVHWLQPDWVMGWGWGFNIQRLEGKTYVGHGGSVKGYRTHLRINLEDKIAVIVLTNADDGNPDMYVEKAFQWVAPAIVEVVSKEEAKEAPEMWGAYTGKYRSDWGDTQILILNEELVMVDPSQPDPMIGMTKLIPVSEHTFRMESKQGYGSPGELIVFEMDKGGRVKRVKTGATYTQPVDDW
jgi:CubicO group peptidase (beta-lactamase class C family)